MTELRQKQPRVQEPRYLAWLRKQGCACGCGSPPPSDAAHLRAGSIRYKKEYPGLGAKPSDQWALPLNRSCHMRQHAYGDEVGWWSLHGVPDPFGRSMWYYAAYFAQACAALRRKPADAPAKKPPRKPKTRTKHAGIASGGRWPKNQRKIANRPFPKGRKFRNG